MALSQMMKFYFTLKEKYSDSILFFRLGDFYEMFFEDAKIASEVLNLTLTGRNCGLDERAPMCGIPYHAADNYIAKLVNNGYKVAICEQLSEPTKGKDLVDRDVVRVITPGTIIEDNLLEEKSNNYLACICANQNEFAIAWIDVSTGEFNTTQSKLSNFSAVEDMLMTIAPAEILCNQSIFDMTKSLPEYRLERLPKFQKYYEWSFEYNSANKLLLQQFNIISLSLFEFEDKHLSVSACGALMNYVNETQKRALTHISGIKYIQSNKYLTLDSNTRRNLELCANTKDNTRKATLIWVLDKTKTSMGARNLHRWIEQPLRDEAQINDRLDGVQELIKSSKVRSNLGEALTSVKDIERLTSKIAYGNPSPRDLFALKLSLQAIPKVKIMLDMCESKIIKNANDNIFALDRITKMLDDSLKEDELPITISEGGFIKSEFNQNLNELRNAVTLGADWIATLENKERNETGIKNLKINFNKVFGYFIEVNKSNLDKVPFRYQRTQTLTTAERYMTDELREIEGKILGAKGNAILLEQKIYEEIKLELIKVIPELQSTARNIAVCDTILSFATVSILNNYTKPTVKKNIDSIKIVGGRHPVVEALLKTNEFTPNDTLLDCCQNRTMVITGPNMSGKSTYMRQVAIITLMAHIGCFVPASSAEISITDRIFTRIGASDDLAFGKSTFMVEMVEVATILQNSTHNSLLILDEIGRGTSTFDGLSIARAVLEDITERIRCKTLFSTHYHELTELEDNLEGVKNYKIIAAERNNGIVFLHKIMRGGTNKSFGIEVAKLAGLPQSVLSRAKEISKFLELNPISSSLVEKAPLLDCVVENEKFGELGIMIKNLKLNELTPLEALLKLEELQDFVQKQSNNEVK